MNWYYESAGQQQGPVSDSEIDRLLAEGKLTLDSLVWREGMSGWAALRTARPSAAAAPVAVPSVGAPAQPGVAPGSGSEIPQPGWIRCSLTGRYFPPSEIIYLEGKPYSAAAKPQVIASMQTGAVLPTSGMEMSGPAWEQREQLGFFPAIWETIKAALLAPGDCFGTMKRTGLGSAMLFWAIVGGGSIVISQLYSVLLQGIIMGAASRSGSAIPSMAMTASMGFYGVIVVPILYFIIVFVFGALVHLSLMMLKGANNPFETTLRVTFYATGAGFALLVIPVCGGYPAMIWPIVSMCIGLGRAQNTTTGIGVGATLIPCSLCCIGFFGLIVAFGAVMAGAMQTLGK